MTPDQGTAAWPRPILVRLLEGTCGLHVASVAQGGVARSRLTIFSGDTRPLSCQVDLRRSVTMSHGTSLT